MKHVAGSFDEYRGCERVTVRGLSLGVNLPPALKQQFKTGGDEVVQGLPPYCPVECGVVDEYGDAPGYWMRGTAKTGSFFFPTAEGRGLWLDFNPNRQHKYHVAVVISIQGVNAVTGQKLVGFAPRLERYDKKCPVHGEDFGHDRFCAQCGFKWPAQNYLADTGTPEGQFWLDGFRNQDGQVRQFTFTPEEMKRGVAQNLIGKERVFAVGVAFFLSKNPRPEPVQKNVFRGAGTGYMNVPNLGSHVYGVKMFGGGQQSAQKLCSAEPQWMGDGSINLNVADDGHQVTVQNFSDVGGEATYSSALGDAAPACLGVFHVEETESLELNERGLDQHAPRTSSMTGPRLERKQVEQVQAAKKLEVAAGARIDQQVYPDPEPLDFWRDEPEAIIYLNYADEATVKAILGGPRVDLTAGGEGFLKDVPVGDAPQGQSV
jgi:hypothetical protein